MTEAQRWAVERVQDQLWDFYQELKTYKTNSTQQQQLSKAGLQERFEKIFSQTTLERNPQPSVEEIIQAKNGTA